MERGLVVARESGIVTAVLDGRIQIGGIEYGGIVEPLVKRGDRVEKNQPIGTNTQQKEAA